MSKDYQTPRLVVEVTEEQKRRLNNLLRWGVGKSVFSSIIDSLINFLEDYGEMGIAAIISGEYDFLNTMKKKKKEGD